MSELMIVRGILLIGNHLNLDKKTRNETVVERQVSITVELEIWMTNCIYS